MAHDAVVRAAVMAKARVTGPDALPGRSPPLGTSNSSRWRGLQETAKNCRAYPLSFLKLRKGRRGPSLPPPMSPRSNPTPQDRLLRTSSTAWIRFSSSNIAGTFLRVSGNWAIAFKAA